MDRFKIIIDCMKGLNCLALIGSHGGPKKSPKRTHSIDGFGRPATSLASGLAPFIRYAVVGLLSYLGDIIHWSNHSGHCRFFFCTMQARRMSPGVRVSNLGIPSSHPPAFFFNVTLY